MKSSAAFCVFLALFCSVIRTVSSSPPSANDVSHRRSLSQASELDATADCPERVPFFPVVMEFSCLITYNLWRPGNTYNDPADLKLENINECCLSCFSDNRCRSWSYDTVTGACALKDAVPEPFGSERFHSSGSYDPILENGTFLSVISVEPSGDRLFPFAFVEGHSVAPIGRCYTKAGVAYPGGSVLRRTRTATHEACCELCRDDDECFSWHRNAKTRRCVLNRNVPGVVDKGEAFAGGTAI